MPTNCKITSLFHTDCYPTLTTSVLRTWWFISVCKYTLHQPSYIRKSSKLLKLNPFSAQSSFKFYTYFHKRLKQRSGSVSVGSLGPGVREVLFEFSKHLWWVWGLILNAISPLLLSCQGFSFALGCGVSFFWWDPVFSCRWLFSHGFDPWVERIPWRRAWQPISVILPGESHKQRSLADYSL